MTLPVEYHTARSPGKRNVLPRLKVGWRSAAMCWVQRSGSASLLVPLPGNGGHFGHPQSKQRCRRGGAGKECR